MKWKWKDLKGAYLSEARLGPLHLEVWAQSGDGTDWMIAFDVSNGEEIATSYYTKTFPTREKAKAATEKLANKWLEKLDKARAK